MALVYDFFIHDYAVTTDGYDLIHDLHDIHLQLIPTTD